MKMKIKNPTPRHPNLKRTSAGGAWTSKEIAGKKCAEMQIAATRIRPGKGKEHLEATAARIKRPSASLRKRPLKLANTDLEKQTA